MAKEETSRGWLQPKIELGPSGTAPPGPTSGYVKTGRIVNGKTEYIKKRDKEIQQIFLGGGNGGDSDGNGDEDESSWVTVLRMMLMI